MSNTIFLTAQESTLFSRLSDQLQADWEITEETQSHQDTPDDLRIRLDIMTIEDPRVHELQDRVPADISPDELDTLVSELDLTDLSDTDTAQILYALGPNLMSSIIGLLLAKAQTAEDVEQAAAYSFFRHEWLASVPTAQ